MFIPNILFFKCRLIFSILKKKMRQMKKGNYSDFEKQKLNSRILTLHKFLGKCLWIGHRISLEWYFLSINRVAIFLTMPFGRMNVQMKQLNHLYCTCPLQYQMFYNQIVRIFSYFHFYLYKYLKSMWVNFVLFFCFFGEEKFFCFHLLFLLKRIQNK